MYSLLAARGPFLFLGTTITLLTESSAGLRGQQKANEHDPIEAAREAPADPAHKVLVFPRAHEKGRGSRVQGPRGVAKARPVVIPTNKTWKTYNTNVQQKRQP
jgi:hypothetical protein